MKTDWISAHNSLHITCRRLNIDPRDHGCDKYIYVEDFKIKKDRFLWDFYSEELSTEKGVEDFFFKLRPGFGVLSSCNVGDLVINTAKLIADMLLCTEKKIHDIDQEVSHEFAMSLFFDNIQSLGQNLRYVGRFRKPIFFIRGNEDDWETMNLFREKLRIDNESYSDSDLLLPPHDFDIFNDKIELCGRALTKLKSRFDKKSPVSRFIDQKVQSFLCDCIENSMFEFYRLKDRL